MNKKIYGAALILAPVLLLAGCLSPAQKASQKASESIAEKAIEDATGGEADVDIDNNQLNVNTEEGSMQFGENVSLPADFPSDVYVYEGAVKGVITSNDPRGYTVTIETDKPAADIKAAYERKMKDEGWKITATMDFGDSITLAGEKDNRTMSVIVGRSDEKTSIILSVGEKS